VNATLRPDTTQLLRAKRRRQPPGDRLAAALAIVDEQHWQRSLPLVVQAGALDAVRFVLLCQGERCGDESRIAPRFSFVSRGYLAAEKPRS
jgi:hypothetical protein